MDKRTPEYEALMALGQAFQGICELLVAKGHLTVSEIETMLEIRAETLAETSHAGAETLRYFGKGLRRRADSDLAQRPTRGSA